jgi:acetyl-CoA synthetase
VINVSGHRMGTAEVESALVAHDQGRRGRRGRLSARHQGPGHLRLRHADGGEEPTEELRKELVAWVRKEIGPIASPDLIQFAPGLPKTRSGKIMRRILRKIAENDFRQSRRHLDARRSRRGRCIRMYNDDVMDLYTRVTLGTPVIVTR